MWYHARTNFSWFHGGSEMLKRVALILAALVVVFLAVAATRPDSFRIERSAFIAAPPGVVFSLVNDFHQWAAWSPWEKLDPNMKKTYEGAPAGVGAGYYWLGNDQVGEGRMTITASRPDEQVSIQLVFMKPWQAKNTSTFTMAPQGDGTRITWAMEGTNNFMAKAFSLFVNMDSMVGKDFERGLDNMKEPAVNEAHKRAAAEAAARAAAAASAAAVPAAPAGATAPQ
jgi:uncharacterized protein YndB with AHSA1/START domain